MNDLTSMRRVRGQDVLPVDGVGLIQTSKVNRLGDRFDVWQRGILALLKSIRNWRYFSLASEW